MRETAANFELGYEDFAAVDEGFVEVDDDSGPDECTRDQAPTAL